MKPSHSHSNVNVQDQNEIFFNFSNFDQKSVSWNKNQTFFNSASHKTFQTVSVYSKCSSRTTIIVPKGLSFVKGFLQITPITKLGSTISSSMMKPGPHLMDMWTCTTIERGRQKISTLVLRRIYTQKKLVFSLLLRKNKLWDQ